MLLVRDFIYENWVYYNYVIPNPRLQAIISRIDKCNGEVPIPLFNRLHSEKIELTKMYMNDPEVKKKWKTLKAIEKLSETHF